MPRERKTPRAGTDGTCRLCLEWRPLRGSHILPELLYKPTYDAKRKAVIVRLGEMHKGSISLGLRERILCESCEMFLNRRYEDYFAREWRARRPTRVDGESITIAGFDYRRVLLLLLSIIWRASVASRKEFADAKVSRAGEESLRRLVLGESEELLRWYRVYATVLVDDQNHIFDAVVRLPQRCDSHRDVDHLLIAGGCCWHVIELADNESAADTPPSFLCSTGELHLVRQLWSDNPLIRASVPLFREIQAAEARRRAQRDDGGGGH